MFIIGCPATLKVSVVSFWGYSFQVSLLCWLFRLISIKSTLKKLLSQFHQISFISTCNKKYYMYHELLLQKQFCVRFKAFLRQINFNLTNFCHYKGLFFSYSSVNTISRISHGSNLT